MTRSAWVRAAWALVVVLGLCACDDDDDPGTLDGKTQTDGSKTDGTGGGGDGKLRDGGLPWDGIDPKCPMPGPCVLTVTGEGKHSEDALVIGEILTLTGKNLGAVDAVYIGSAEAVFLSASATEVRARVAPKTPPGSNSVEVKAGVSRRKFAGPLIRRLLAIAATDDTKLALFDAPTRSAYPSLDLGEAAAEPLRVDPTGRYIIARGKTKLVVADLAREQVAVVGGLSGETVVGYAGDSAGKNLLVATASGKLLAASLASFPTLTASAVSGAPGTTAVLPVGSSLLAGLHPTAASSSEGSIWTVKEDLKTFSYVQSSGTPLRLGSASGLKLLDAAALDGEAAFLALDGATPRLALLTIGTGAVSSAAALQLAAGPFGVAVTAGGAYAAFSTNASAPAASYTPATSPTQKSLTLGGSGAVRLLARPLPARKNEVAVLVGPQPTTGGFVAGSLELLDLSKPARLTSSAGAALTLADLRDAAGDPLEDRVHLCTGTHFRTYGIAVSGTTATMTEIHPQQILTSGKDHRFIAIQP